MIDLHSHTTASDGQHPPEELIAMAKNAGVTRLAVTDHDTVAGIERASAEGARIGVGVIAGIELSAFLERQEVHVLGHFVDPRSAELGSFSDRLRGERRIRMERMVDKMRALGYPITLDEVLAIAGDAQLGRPHLARALVARNWVTSTKEAFDRFLGDGKPAHVDRFKLTAQEAIALIHRAGGTATLAHPAVSKVNPFGLEQLKRSGLDGLEVFHSDHDAGTREKLLASAKALDLVPTAGSDFHGEAVAPGRRLGTAAMPLEHFEALERRRPAR